MIDLYFIARPLLMKLPPETAHRATLLALRAGLAPLCRTDDPILKTTAFGRSFPNPLGLAAGFDKDAEVINPTFKMGFGFVEAGTVTLRAQPGNDKPRLFRDVENQSVINRLGFPGRGIEYFINNVKKPRAGILGINIGINKGTPTPVDDYCHCMEMLSPYADYITVNVSSPNTQGLRSLQAKEELTRLLSALSSIKKTPMLLKIAPDLTPDECSDIAEVAMAEKIDGLIISNTTVTRPDALADRLKGEKGGLSGKLLTHLSTARVAYFYHLTEGRLPIMGVGGISSAEDAYDKITAGASLVQVYTGLIYQGPHLITRILNGLPALLRRDGFKNVAEAVGTQMDTGKQKLKAVI